MNNSDENLRQELYFLIAKFLGDGPCQRSASILKEELLQHRLLTRRLDWTGLQHVQSYEETNSRNYHIADNHLAQICTRILPLLEQCIPASVRGVESLLGAGCQSVLRQVKGTTRHSVNSLSVCHHGVPLLPPAKERHAPNIGQVIFSRQMNGTSSIRNVATPNLYSKQSMHCRILGHLSAVYCVLFDRTGQCIITGADDGLVKIWSCKNGRLLATLRGHQAEISDMAINYENTLVAAGSCDKIIRLWSLKTTAPVAVLQGHTGMITSLQFCPSILNDARYLMSTGADGTVCFWKWELTTLTFESKPIRFIEKSRPGTQMVCSSFSPGGSFLVAGSTDHIIRIYQMAPGPPERIAQLDVHVDHVDSIQFSHGGDRFLSGSRDGTARIWYFQRSSWKHILIDISKRLPDAPPMEESLKALKPRVTMVEWDLWDQHVITANNDHTIKVWESANGNLVHMLTGHQDEVFVLEAHPTDPHILLSAGHDGYVILWDLRIGSKIQSFHNSLEGQGHGAVFDCKFSPDGMELACSDSHGHLCIFGYGSSDPYSAVPSEQFFHTDYRPLIRDSNNYVLDEQTQTAPHLMAPPFLVDVDGNPHPLHYQRLVPGHSSNVNAPRRNAEPPPTPGDELPPLLAEIQAAEARERMGIVGDLVVQSPPPQPPVPQPPLQSPGGSRNYGMRQSGAVEGVRLIHGSIPVIQDVSDADVTTWRTRRIVPKVKPAIAKYNDERRTILGREEIMSYLREKKKRPLPSTSARIPEVNNMSDLPKNRRSSVRRSSSRSNRSANRSANRNAASSSSTRRPAPYSTRRSVALAVEESGDEEAMITPSESEEEEEWSESSGSESSEYSDWTEEVGLRAQPQAENRRIRRIRQLLSSSDEEGDAVEPGPSSPQRQTKQNGNRETKKPAKKKKPARKPKLDEAQEILQYYQPPDWLLVTCSSLSPYVPQIGDEVYYFSQGHESYVKEVLNQKMYDINPKKQCFYKLQLKTEELCRLVSLHHAVGPPTLCCLKLALINPETGNSTGATFTVKYHDMADVLDFIILRQHYDSSVGRNWQPGDRFRSVIDDSWWAGVITERSPFQPDFPDSHFQCYMVRWDTGEIERMSPWDLQPVPESDSGSSDQNMDASGAASSNIPLTDADKDAMAYVPDEQDWLGEGQECLTQRVVAGLDALSQLTFAGPFVFPVEVQAYPDYWRVVPYPTDLNNIREKLLNRFYRRATALLWEVKQLERNARLYNEEDSQIVKNCTRLVTIATNFVRDSSCVDVLSLCDGEEDEEGEIEVDHVPEPDGEDLSSSQASEVAGKRKRNSDADSTNKRTKQEQEPHLEPWIRSASQLLDFLVSREDAEPFRHPVNLDNITDYMESVQEPIDFSTVYQRLDSSMYADPEAFVRDVQLIFSNSRAYNTTPRSRIYGMTIRLSAMFEDRVDSVLRDWYESASGGARRTRLRTQRLLQAQSHGSSQPSAAQSRPTLQLNSFTSNGASTSVSSDVSYETIGRRESLRTRSAASRAASTSVSGEHESNARRQYVTVPPRDNAITNTRRNAHVTRSSDEGETEGSMRTRSSARRELITRISLHGVVTGSEHTAGASVISGQSAPRYSTRRQTSLALRDEEQNGMESGENESDQEEEEDEEEEEDGEGIAGEDDEEAEDEEEEDEDSEEETGIRNASYARARSSHRRPTTRPTVSVRKLSSSRSGSRRNCRLDSNTSRGSRRTSEASVENNNSAPARSRNLRTRTRSQRVHYHESESDSESERGDSYQVSSRGRVRRPTLRMMDYME